MSLRINQNVMSLSTYASLSQTSSRLEKSIQKLSSGMRINSASDDGAGLAISEKMRRQIRGLSRAVNNAQDGISMIQTAEGALNESQSILQRMRELAIQSSNDTLTSNDRLEIQKEVSQLKDELNHISTSTEFNTKKLLDGSQTALISASSKSAKGLIVGALNGGGGTYDVDLKLLAGGVSEMQRSQIYTINNDSGKLADGETKLQSIAQFYDSNGVFVLDTPQTLTLHGNGKTAKVTLDGQMSLDNLAADIQNSILSRSGLEIQNTTVKTVNTAQSQLAGVGGYLQIVSGSIGSSGQITLSSDQEVLNALGMSITREAVESRVEVTLTDSFGYARRTTTETDRVSGLLDGIDIQFDSQAAQIAGTQGLEAGLLISSAAQLVVSAGGVDTTITVASGHWTMEGLARTINSQITAVDGLKASVVDGELRLAYDKPATTAASIANTVNLSGIAGGAKALGFLAGTYSGFVDAQKDQSAIRQGFSTFVDLSGAGTAEFSIGDGLTAAITVQVSLTSAVNTADMMLFADFQAEVHRQAALVSAAVAVRVDQVGSSMVFTSTRVGNENLDNQAAYTSMLSLSLVTGTATGTSSLGTSRLQQMLGIESGVTAKGSGDKNFKMHVVDKISQLQIGADQGQTMKIAIGDMSAAALGVDRLDLTTVEGAGKAMGALNKALDIVSGERGKLGASQNRLEFAINNLRNSHSNLTASESRIRDADIAMEMIEFTRNQIISQAGTAMLAQANMMPQGVLQLLG